MGEIENIFKGLSYESRDKNGGFMKEEKKTYLRDGRSPIPLNERVSKAMSSNKGKDTKPELVFRKALRDVDASGYRLHWKKAPGRPDIAYPGKRIAVFVNGCFWHRCPYCNPPLPKTHTEFWRRKFERNVERDREKIEALKKDGWTVFVVWECQIKEDAKAHALKIKKELDRRNRIV